MLFNARPAVLCAVLAVLTTIPAGAQAQFAGGGFGQGGFGQGGGQGGGGFGQGGGGGFGQGGGGFGGVGGISIDAKGVVAPVFQKEVAFKLTQKRLEAFAKKNFADNLNASSDMRMVSLVQLEEACRKFADEKKHVSPEIQFLAGLQRIDYVFAYPESGDLVIAGPAEGFAPDALGRVVGITTGRPPLRLDDLIVALRAVPKSSMIGCSIDPTQAGLRAFHSYIERNSTPATTTVIQRRFREMAQAMGTHDVSVFGVPADSHFAEVLVEADYRMKLMSVGLERPRVKGFISHLQALRPGQNTFQRWWFSPLYDAFQQSEDGNAFAFSGQRLQLMAEEERITAAGNRVVLPQDNAVTTQKYARQFTEKFDEIAKVTPVFAELQNITDLSVLIALLQKKQLVQKVGWQMSLFLDEEKTPLVKRNVPRQVQSVYSHRRAGRLILGLVAGGVELTPGRVVASAKFERASRELTAATAQADASRATGKNWWWD